MEPDSTAEVPRPWTERHMIAIFLAVALTGFDLFLIARLHAELFFFGILQIPIALLLALGCFLKANRAAGGLTLLVAVFPFLSGFLEPIAWQMHAHYAGVAEVVYCAAGPDIAGELEAFAAAVR